MTDNASISVQMKIRWCGYKELSSVPAKLEARTGEGYELGSYGRLLATWNRLLLYLSYVKLLRVLSSTCNRAISIGPSLGSIYRAGDAGAP
jgi:hypothetical protein